MSRTTPPAGPVSLCRPDWLYKVAVDGPDELPVQCNRFPTKMLGVPGVIDGPGLAN